MEQDSGRVPDGTGLSQVEPQERLAPTGFDPSRDAFPWFDYADGYPEDEDFGAWFKEPTPRLDFHQAAHWLLRELPRAAEIMPCYCEVKDGADEHDGKPVKLIEFSTGGWSGAESLIGLIERRFDFRHFMHSWKRGGHFVFEIPAHFLEKQSTYERDSDGSPKGGDAEGGSVHDSAGPKDIAKGQPK